MSGPLPTHRPRRLGAKHWRVRGLGGQVSEAACWALASCVVQCVVSLLGDTHRTPESSSWEWGLIPANAEAVMGQAATSEKWRGGLGRSGQRSASWHLHGLPWASQAHAGQWLQPLLCTAT